MENHIFWSEIGSGFGEPGGTLPQEFPGVHSGEKQSTFRDAITGLPEEMNSEKRAQKFHTDQHPDLGSASVFE